MKKLESFIFWILQTKVRKALIIILTAIAFFAFTI